MSVAGRHGCCHCHVKGVATVTNRVEHCRHPQARATVLPKNAEGEGHKLLSTNAFKRRDTYTTMDGHVAIKGLVLGGVITQVSVCLAEGG